MKQIIIALLICMFVYTNTFAVDLLGSGIDSGGANDPVSYYRCEDNAASTTVTATIGPDGTTVGVNSADATTTTAYEGSRAFLPGDGERLESGLLTSYATTLNDGTVTVQFAYYGDNASDFGVGNYVRIIQTSAGNNYRFSSDNGSATSFDLYIGGVNNEVILDNINTGSWHLIRIVVDTGETNKVTVYQGTTEGNLSSKFVRTAATTDPAFGADPKFTFGGSGSSNQSIFNANGIMDYLKVWDTAEYP